MLEALALLGIVALVATAVFPVWIILRTSNRRSGKSETRRDPSASLVKVPCDICILTNSVFHCKVHSLNLCEECARNHDKQVCVYEMLPRQEVVWR